MNRFSWLTGTLMLVAAVTFAQDVQPSDESPTPAATAPVVPVAKVPIPDAAALKKAGALANDVYGKDISTAKTAEAKAALGKKLLQSGIDEQGDRAARYVLFGMATDMAVQAADIETALSSVDEQVKCFEVDGLKSRADTLAKLARMNGADATVLAEQCARLIDEAIAVDRYEIARKVAGQSVLLADKNGDRGAVQTATSKVQEVKIIEAGHEQAVKAQATLATDSNNTEAYLTAGRFLCFLKGDWEKGVPMLANSSDKALKAVADMELGKPAEAAKQVELADGWWELAKKEQGLSQRNLRDHAGEWYKKALPSLTGVLKLKAGMRLEAIEQTKNSPVWMVLFRSDDPSIWNKNVNEGQTRFAIALSRVPDDIRFLRMACAGKSVIVPISKPQVAGYNAPVNGIGWNGSAHNAYRGIHLGLFSRAYAHEKDSVGMIGCPLPDYRGWGFGHRFWKDDKQGYAWEGKEIKRSVFEIAVTSSHKLSTEEGNVLLTNNRPAAQGKPR